MAEAATAAGAEAMSIMLNMPVRVGDAQLRVTRLADAYMVMETMPQHMTVVYIEAEGNIAGQLILVCPTPNATAMARILLGNQGGNETSRAAARRDAMGEVGNIVLTSYLNAMVELTGLEGAPTPPMVAMDVSSAVLQLPLARAASDADAVVRFDAAFAMGEAGDAVALRTPFHVLFLPAPGTLNAMVDVLDDNTPRTDIRVSVRMGELAVSRRPGDQLVAEGLGSCIGVALIDRQARVGAVAHVMLPDAPDNWRISGRPTYAARYANTAIPALVSALERAGGRRSFTRAYIAGGGQMFTGSIASTIDVPRRNVEAVKAALRAEQIRIVGDETGGSSSRTLTVNVHDLSVIVNVNGSSDIRLDAA